MNCSLRFGFVCWVLVVSFVLFVVFFLLVVVVLLLVVGFCFALVSVVLLFVAFLLLLPRAGKHLQICRVARQSLNQWLLGLRGTNFTTHCSHGASLCRSGLSLLLPFSLSLLRLAASVALGSLLGSLAFAVCLLPLASPPVCPLLSQVDPSSVSGRWKQMHNFSSGTLPWAVLELLAALNQLAS